MKNNILYIGNFTAFGNESNQAASSAGNQAQSSIIDAIKKEFPHFILKKISMNPIRTWPYSSLYWMGYSDNENYFPFFLNIAGVKRLFFAFFLFKYLINFRPKIVIKYNISFFEELSVISYLLFFKKAFSVAIIQDIFCAEQGKKNIRWFSEFLSMKLIKKFDFIVAISDKIKSYFNLPDKKTIIFKGAPSCRWKNLLLDIEEDNLLDYAVFAGALEKYNGIDILIHEWNNKKIPLDIHIFGKGSCEDIILKASSENKRILYHGYREEDVIVDWQRKAKVNLCLRYPKGIDDAFFFPSKFFNILCTQGSVVVNNFYGLDDEMKSFCIVLPDDLSGLYNTIISLRRIGNEKKKEWIAKNADWDIVLKEISLRFQHK